MTFAAVCMAWAAAAAAASVNSCYLCSSQGENKTEVHNDAEKKLASHVLSLPLSPSFRQLSRL